MSAIPRRSFLTALAAAPLINAADAPTRAAKVTKLFRSPDGHPNALEATPEGLWIGEQVTDRAYLVDWQTGAVKKKFDTESSNTSGMAVGGGYIWMGANGGPVLREPKPGERKDGRIVQVDIETGRTVKVHRTPDEGGVHGVLWADNALWLTCFKWKTIAKVDPKTFKVLHQFPLVHTRPHGLAWDPPAMWVGYSNDFVFLKQDVKDGKVLETVTLAKDVDPDPHGMDMYQGKLYYCDAGISPGGKESGSAGSGWVCRID